MVENSMNIHSKQDALMLSAGSLCLEFANTAEWHASAFPEEHLNHYTDLVTWTLQIGILSQQEAQQLLHDASANPQLAKTVLANAVVLREAVYHLFSALAAGRPIASGDLAAINQVLPLAMAGPRLVSTSSGFDWDWEDNVLRLDCMLMPVVRSAAQLLTSGELDRIGECADDRGCGYLFFDISRNRSRRWCDMNSCGNRAKARRHYARQRADDTTF